jgi:mannose-6-phosphate isomerase-like protein (cupin superfamily)
MTRRRVVNPDRKIIALGPNEGEAKFVIGDVVTFKLTGADYDNAYFLTEIVSTPGGGPAFLHTHMPQETFWILEGEYEVYGRDENGGKYAIPARAGSMVHVPGNVPHGFRNVGDSTGKLIALYAPVGPQFAFFNDIGVPMDSSTDAPPTDQMPSVQTVLEVFARHDMHLLEDLPGE